MKKFITAFFRSDLWMAMASVALAYLMGYMAGRVEAEKACQKAEAKQCISR